MGRMGNPYIFDFCINEYVSHYLPGMERKEDVRMNWQGLVFMLTVWVVVSGLFFYSFYRILFGDRKQHRKKNSQESRNDN